jgi:hypothetical protein
MSRSCISQSTRLIAPSMKDCVLMRDRLSARTAKRAVHKIAVNSTFCDGGVLRAPVYPPYTNTARQAAASLPSQS